MDLLFATQDLTLLSPLPYSQAFCAVPRVLYPGFVKGWRIYGALSEHCIERYAVRESVATYHVPSQCQHRFLAMHSTPEAKLSSAPSRSVHYPTARSSLHWIAELGWWATPCTLQGQGITAHDCISGRPGRAANVRLIFSLVTHQWGQLVLMYTVRSHHLTLYGGSQVKARAPAFLNLVMQV